MNFKEIRSFLQSNCTVIYLTFNNGLKLDVYYCFKVDVIYTLETDKTELKEFNGFLEFSNYLSNKYNFELEFKDKYNELQVFKTIYLRHNFCLNKPFLTNVENSIQKYLEKFNLLFGVNVSPYEEISESELSQINAIMQNIINNHYDKIARYEIPILIFVGEYFKNKYHSEWELLNVSNDFGNDFVIPEIKINGKAMELSRSIYRYLNHPNLKYGYEKFRFSYFLDLDFIVTQTLIIPKKQ
ncbi:hypothetical protein ACJD0Z_04165 [Flavobacteriaceae bacterium M23B6Z8]